MKCDVSSSHKFAWLVQCQGGCGTGSTRKKKKMRHKTESSRENESNFSFYET